MTHLDIDTWENFNFDGKYFSNEDTYLFLFLFNMK